MSFVKRTDWVDWPNTSTPVMAADLLRIEDGIEDVYLWLKIQRNTTNTTIDDTAYQWNGNTNGGSFIYELPAGVQGIQRKIVNTGTSRNQLTITPNGSEKLLGANTSFTLNDGESLIIGYDTTDGWY